MVDAEQNPQPVLIRQALGHNCQRLEVVLQRDHVLTTRLRQGELPMPFSSAEIALYQWLFIYLFEVGVKGKMQKPVLGRSSKMVRRESLRRQALDGGFDGQREGWGPVSCLYIISSRLSQPERTLP